MSNDPNENEPHAAHTLTGLKVDMFHYFPRYQTTHSRISQNNIKQTFISTFCRN